MNILKRLGRTLMLLLTLVFVGNLLLMPQAAHAGGGDGKKKPHIPIIVGPSTIIKDPPKKHDSSGQ